MKMKLAVILIIVLILSVFLCKSDNITNNYYEIVNNLPYSKLQVTLNIQPYLLQCELLYKVNITYSDPNLIAYNFEHTESFVPSSNVKEILINNIVSGSAITTVSMYLKQEFAGRLPYDIIIWEGIRNSSSCGLPAHSFQGLCSEIGSYQNLCCVANYQCFVENQVSKISLVNPEINILSPIQNSVYNGTMSIPVYGTFNVDPLSNNKTINYSLDSSNWTPVAFIENSNSGMWSMSDLLVSSLSNGSHSIQVELTDELGGKSVCSPVNFVIDPCLQSNINTSTPGFDGTSINNYTTSSTISIYGNYSKDVTCSFPSVSYSLDGGIWTPVGLQGSVSGSIGYWTLQNLNAPALSINQHSIVIKVEDDCGCSSSTNTYRFNVAEYCLESGIASITPGFDGTSINNYGTAMSIPVYGTYSNNSSCTFASVSYSLDGSGWLNVDQQSISGSSYGYWTSYNINNPPLGIYQHSILFKVNDNCGCSSLSNTYLFNISSSCLLSRIVSTTPGLNGTNINDFLTTSIIPIYGTFSKGSACSSATILYSIDGSTWSSVSSYNVSGSSYGYWTKNNLNNPLLSINQHSVVLKVIDSCGCSSKTNNINFNITLSCSNLDIDIIQPIAWTSYSIISDIPLYGTFIDFTGGVHTISYILGSSTWSNVTSYDSTGTSGYWTNDSLSGSSLGFGSHNLTVKIDFNNGACIDMSSLTFTVN